MDTTAFPAPSGPVLNDQAPHPTVSFSGEIFAENIVGWFPGFGVTVTTHGGKTFEGLLGEVVGEWPDEYVTLRDWDVYPDPPIVAWVPWSDIADIHVH